MNINEPCFRHIEQPTQEKNCGKDVEVVPRSGREAGTPITFELGMTEQGTPQVM